MHLLKNHFSILILLFLLGCQNAGNEKKNPDLLSTSVSSDSASSVVSVNSADTLAKKDSVVVQAKVCKLYFGNENGGSYRIDMNGSDVFITYQFSDFKNKEKVKIENGKIYVSKEDYGSYHKSLDQIYKVKGSSFYAYNPESDEYDIYPFKKAKSSCDLQEVFK